MRISQSPTTRIRRRAVVSVRLTPRERDRWHAAAVATDSTLTELVRESVRHRLLLLERQARPEVVA